MVGLPPPLICSASFQRRLSKPPRSQRPSSRGRGVGIRRASRPTHCKDHKRLNQEPLLPLIDARRRGAGRGGDAESPRDHLARGQKTAGGPGLPAPLSTLTWAKWEAPGQGLSPSSASLSLSGATRHTRRPSPVLDSGDLGRGPAIMHS